MADRSTQLAVIGGGPGGYGAAFLAADLGVDVTIVDPEPDPGGVCLYRGCIPSKALLHVAKVVGEAVDASGWGMDLGTPEVDIDEVRQFKERVVAKLTRGLGGLADRRNVEHVRGTARFEGPWELAVDEGDRTTSLAFDHAIVATGSEPVELPGLTFDDDRVMSSAQALELPEIPDRLLVVGAGYIGLEMATVYQALGSEVTVVEVTPDLLPGADRELVEPLEDRLVPRLEEVMLETMVDQTREVDDGLEVVVEGPDEPEPVVVDRVLVAVGRRPRSGQLGLEKTRVEVGPDGFVDVDEQRRTADRHIFAIGDVVAEPMLAHKATHEGRVAARVIAGEEDVYDPRAIPAVVYTDPQVAWCGLMEDEARGRGRDVAVGRFPWTASGRAATMDRSGGLTKVVADAATGRVLGVGICGPEAGELMGEAALCLEMAATVEDLAETVHPHPTLSETLMEAAEDVFGESTHY